MWARIDGDIVAEITDIDPTDRYPASLIWQPVPDEWQAWIKPGYGFADGAFDAPVSDLARQMRADLADRRWRQETAGHRVGDFLIATDDRSKTLLNGKVQTAVSDPDATHRWKIGEDAEVQLTSAQIIAIGRAVSNYVQGCFDRELDIIALLTAAATASDLLAVYSSEIETGWPE